MAKEDLGGRASPGEEAAKPCAWRVKVSDGVTRYFESHVEAEFFAKDTAEAGFTVRTSPVPLPQDVRSFVAFLEDAEEDRKHAEYELAAIERVTPNWQAYRSLAEAVEVAIHHVHSSLTARSAASTTP